MKGFNPSLEKNCTHSIEIVHIWNTVGKSSDIQNMEINKKKMQKLRASVGMTETQLNRHWNDVTCAPTAPSMREK